MMIIQWCDGVDTLPNGSPCRQLPQKHVWSSTVWCSADGLLWRRFYNPVSKQWKWADEPYTLTIDEGGTVGYLLDWWMSADRCVALAWLHRAENGSDRIQEKVTVQLVDADARRGDAASGEERVMRVDAIEWVDDGDEPEDSGSVPGEKWKALRWSCGLIPCDGRYRISNYGRLWSPHTRTITSGFWFDNDRWAAVRGGSLVPLRAAAGLQPAGEKMQPRVRLAYDALMSGYAPSDLENASGLELSTCWNYFTKGSIHVPGKELRRRAQRLVPTELWGALEKLKARDDKRLGGSLTDLMERIQRMVPSRVLEGEHVMSQLRLARTALTAP
jgi:hypothetical protein